MTPELVSFLDPDPLSLVVDDRRFLLQHDNTIALLYVFRGYTPKPYIAVLQGPSGRNVLEDSPGDHVHHHGVWWGHGDVNGVDFYLEVPAEGRRLGAIEHAGFDELTDDNPTWGFVERLRWVDDAGNELISERRSVLMHYRDRSHYTVDLDSTYTAQCDLALGDTKESVMPGLRVAEPLTGVCGGHLRASGGRKGEGRIMGQPATWIDYWGKRKAIYGLGDLTEGVATFDHPSNPNHPNVFFMRTYGPSSPFQGNYFIGPSQMGEGESMRYRHRLVVHYGNTEDADIDGKYQAWTRETS